MSGMTLPAVFMRGGTSKGLFFLEKDLPAEAGARDRLLLAAMGSPDPYGRQLNGMGGGISSLSKIIIVRPSADGDADVDYLHGQVAVGEALIDYSANCGNLSGAVGPFAINQGLVEAGEGEALVRLRNLNTGDLIHARVPVAGGRYAHVGDFAFPGVGGANARIVLEYIRPGDGLMLPTGRTSDRLALDGGDVDVTLSFSPLPTVWVRAADVGLDAAAMPDQIDADHAAMRRLEQIRRSGAVRMGLAASPESANQASPKVGIVGPPAGYTALDGACVETGAVDLVARVVSMGRVHKALPMACAMNLAATGLAAGTIPHGLAGTPDAARVRLGSPSGVISMGVVLERDAAGLPLLDRVRVETTARTLMEGQVHCD